MIVNSKSLINRFISVDVPSPRELFSAAISMRNRGIFSGDEEIPVIASRTLDSLDDLVNFDKMMAQKESEESNKND